MFKLLQPHEICEFAKDCLDNCNGKNPNREGTFSCGLRRGLLIANEDKKREVNNGRKIKL